MFSAINSLDYLCPRCPHFVVVIIHVVKELYLSGMLFQKPTPLKQVLGLPGGVQKFNRNFTSITFYIGQVQRR